MKRLLILGAGTAGTMAANHLRHVLNNDWSITIVDQNNAHHYQPGYLFVPFGMYTPRRVSRPRRNYIPEGVEFIESKIKLIKADQNKVELADGRVLEYDWIIVATGTVPRPDQTPGMLGDLWRKKIFDFYTLSGATYLHDKLATFEGGKVLVHITEMPIKCPVAPLEFTLLAEDFFRKRGIRHKVDITYVTPLDGAFTKPVASKAFGDLLEDRSIRLATDFSVSHIDNENSKLVSYDGRELPFDLLVTIPLNMGQQVIIDSGLGNELGFIPVDKHTLRSDKYDNMFVLGDASNIPTSKAGAVAHFATEMFIDNFLAAVEGKPLPNEFDGHANCFIESGRGQALLIDFNYDTEPLTGHFPLPVVGPMKLLGRTCLNHMGKLAFEKIYWNILMRGRTLPISPKMSMVGKNVPKEKEGES